jgi:non-homologous end joining protein Ku
MLDFNSKLKYVYATTPTESFDRYLIILEDDGFKSLKKFLTKTFKITFRSYYNCKDILDDFASEGDGMYNISPNADGTDSYQVYCDMTTDG